MANTIDANLVVDILSERVLTTLGNAVAPFGFFASDFSDQAAENRTSIQIPLVSAASTVLTDATDFEQTDATVGAVNVVMNQYTVPFGISNSDLQNGKRIEWLAEKSLQALGDKLKGVINERITSAYTNTAVTVAQASFVEASAKSLWASLKSGRKYLILDKTAFSQILPANTIAYQREADGTIPNIYGFDRVACDTYWTSVGVANTYGFAATPNALAMASRTPTLAPQGSNLVAQRNVSLPNGLTVQVNVWFSTKSRSLWSSYDVLFGAARGDVTALTVVKSA